MMQQGLSLLRTIDEKRKEKFTGFDIKKGEVEEPSLASRLFGSRIRGRQRNLFLQDFQMTPRDMANKGHGKVYVSDPQSKNTVCAVQITYKLLSFTLEDS